MSLIAGIYCRDPEARVDDAWLQAVSRVLSRHPGDRAAVFHQGRAAFAAVDVGAHAQPAVVAAGSTTLMTGELLLAGSPGSRPQGRHGEVQGIRDEWQRLPGLLRRSTGIFSLAHYDPTTGELVLATDRLGIRPLYYWLGARHVVFASALRVLEACAFVPKVMDLRGVTETACLGFALGTRTPYHDIHRIHAAELVSLRDAAVVQRRYWHWDQVPPARAERPVAAAVAESYELFREAVDRRLGGDRATVAYLTGGMDSRAIVAQLRHRAVQTYTFTFAVTRSHDEMLAEHFAALVGTVHESVRLEPQEWRWSTLMAEAWGRAQARAVPLPERPRLVWSGDGGSVGVGHVYMSRALVDAIRNGNRAKAFTSYLEPLGATVLTRYLRRSAARHLGSTLEEGINEELAALAGAEPGRAFHLFLLLNDQRRHLTTHFEDIDLHRLEFHLPFYDGPFLESVLTNSVDACLGHRFYAQWFARFPRATEVAWQTYPGHEACPLPLPEAARYQWSASAVEPLQRWQQVRVRNAARELTAGGNFPSPILNRFTVGLAALVQRLGMADYSYVIRFASVYHRYWQRCEGRVA